MDEVHRVQRLQVEARTALNGHIDEGQQGAHCDRRHFDLGSDSSGGDIGAVLVVVMAAVFGRMMTAAVIVGG